MMIPKVIHYCWFGRKALPQSVLSCIETWKKVLPGYTLKLWSEENFDIDRIPYVRQAYAHGKYAFVSDYVRMYALYHEGGIYFDTDIEVLKPFDVYLSDRAFIGFENRTMLGTGVIGGEKGFPLFKKMLDYYDCHDFVSKDGYLDFTTNVSIIVGLLEEEGFQKANSEQVINGLHIYERDIFCPKKLDETHFRTTPRSVSIHHYEGTWLTPRQKRRGSNRFWINVCRPVLKTCQRCLSRLIGAERARRFEIKLRDKIK